MNSSADQLTTIIERARALGPLERANYIRRACGADETLLSRVLLALRGDESKPGFWDEVGQAESHGAATTQSLEGQLPGPSAANGRRRGGHHDDASVSPSARGK